MAFNMTNATYGRDQQGINKLQQTYSAEIKSISNSLTGEKYIQMINLIRENWSGQDANNFINDIEKRIKTLKSDILSYDSKINRALQDAYIDFVKFQSNNKI